jgi:hypothetical protein
MSLINIDTFIRHTKRNSFGIPEGYFDSFQDQIQAKIAEEKLMDTYGNANPFAVPEGYSRILTAAKHEHKEGRLLSMLKPWMSVAAGILVVFAIWQIVLNSINTSEGSIAANDSTQLTEYSEIFDFSNLNDDDLAQVAADYMYEYDDEALYQLSGEESENNTELSINEEIIYEYYIDYSDDYSDYEDLLAEL